jgi:hypothetical protein
MNNCKLVFIFVMVFVLKPVVAGDINVPFTQNLTAGNIGELTGSIEDAESRGGITILNIWNNANNNSTYTFTSGYNATTEALPTIKNSTIYFNSADPEQAVTFENRAENPLRFAYVLGNGKAIFTDVIINDFNADSSGGGVVLAKGNGQVQFSNVYFNNNRTMGQGSIFNALEQSAISLEYSTVTNSHADQSGGVLHYGDFSIGGVVGSRFNHNSSGGFGEVFALDSQANVPILIGGNTIIYDSLFFDMPIGSTMMYANTIVRGKQASTDTSGMNATALAKLSNILFDTFGPLKKSDPQLKALCNDFGTNSFESLGHNISFEDSCNLNQSTDLNNTDPRINPVDSNGVISLANDSPAIDAGPSTFLNNPNGFSFLPCGYKDSRGLGRPQDADGDGQFECDVGAYEVQGGADLSNAQSGLFFDSDRSGEGIIVEMLADNRVLVSMFTYHPNGTDLMWFISVGKVVGNTVVMDNVQRTSGGVFGSKFDPSQIIRRNVGGMSLIFPDCNATDKPGRLVFHAGYQFRNELEHLLVKNNRLTQLLSCNQVQNNPMSGRSGSFFDPARSGEGVFVEVLDDGRAVVIFYTYTPDGKQFWFISSDAQINGNTITANMVYPASSTGFGSQFNADEIDLQPWGTVTLEYLPGCDQVTVTYNSVIAGFGTGILNYQRLSRLAGITCDL